MSTFTFADLGVPATLVNALARAGVTEPFPVQTATLPDGIAGRDILARAQTGSGKTLAFGLAMLTRLAGRQLRPLQPYGIVLVPTRELAIQVSDGLAPLADAAGMRIRLVAGGMPYNKQIDALRRGVHIVVATPGRLTDLVTKGAVDLSETAITVLDEADQMADMGFLPQVQEILDLTKPGSQRLLFSATLGGEIDVLVKAYMKNPARHELTAEHAPVETMEHHVLLVHPMDKNDVAARIAARTGRTIFFVRTQAGVDRLTEHLNAQGVPAGGLHGGKSQAVRSRTLDAFRDGVTPALVATDVAARGIHVDDISLVVHVDAPAGPKDYLHRAGRTARAGESGTVVLLANPRGERAALRLVGSAGVDPRVTRIRLNESHLADITGARIPSGVPWTPPKPKSSVKSSKTNRRHFDRHDDRPKRGDRPGRDDRTVRSAYGDRDSRAPREDRPSRGGYAGRDERPARDDRPSRGVYSERDYRAPHEDRPSRDTYRDRDNRPSRDERPARPAYGDRSERSDRGSYSDRNQRPNRSTSTSRDHRPSRDARAGRDDRPSRSGYAAQGERSDRSSYSERNDRPRREDRGGRNESAPRDDRPRGAKRTVRDDKPRGGSFDAKRGERSAKRSGGNARSDRFEAKSAPARDRGPREGRSNQDAPKQNRAERRAHLQPKGAKKPRHKAKNRTGHSFR